MRILVLSHYFPPEVNAPASRMHEHCRRWVALGARVTVLTCVPNHPRGIVYPGYRNRFFQRERVDGIDVVRLWTFVTANEGFVKRTLSYLSYMLAATLAAPFLPRADIVLSTSPQFFNGLAGYFVSRLKRARWILEIRDLWPESILVVGAIRNRAVIGALRWLERFAYGAADAIVPVTDAFRRYMESVGVPSSRIEVIKNGVDLRFFQRQPSGDAVRAELGLEGKIVCSYFGTHGMAHHLETLLDAADMLRERGDIAFLMVGDGAERERLVAARDARGLSNVTMLPQQPKAAMPALWSATDMSLVLLRKADLFRMVIPSKIFESMAMQRPIVLGVEGESRDIVEAAQAGVCCEPQDANALVAAVLELAGDGSRRETLGGNGRRYVAEHYDRDVLARLYLQLMERVGQREPGARMASHHE